MTQAARSKSIRDFHCILDLEMQIQFMDAHLRETNYLNGMAIHLWKFECSHVSSTVHLTA